MMKLSKKDRVFVAGFILYVIVSMFFVVWIDTEANAKFVFVYKYLLVPFIVICYAMAFILGSFKSKKKSRLTKVCSPALAGCVLALCTGGYVNFINTVVGVQIPVVVEGKIVKKDRIGSLRLKVLHYFEVEVQARSVTDTVKLFVSENQYAAYEVGEQYEQNMVRSGLEFLYRKRW